MQVGAQQIAGLYYEAEMFCSIVLVLLVAATSSNLTRVWYLSEPQSGWFDFRLDLTPPSCSNPQILDNKESWII